MPVTLQADNALLSKAEIGDLWQSILRLTGASDDHVAVTFISEEEISKLNRQYRKRDKATNVLTFSYTDQPPVEHDVVVCVAVAEREAKLKQVPLKDYLALLIVHGMLHATGLDHERSVVEHERMRDLQAAVIDQNGYTVSKL